MKRRRFMQALAASSAAAPALLGQGQPSAPATPAPTAANPDQLPKLDVSVPDEGADPIPGFFNPAQTATLRKLSETLFPGALDARTPEFMDFLISQSPAERQQLWLAGLDALERQSQTRFNKSFAQTAGGETDALLAPLREPWTQDPPTEPAARLLQIAKFDIRIASMNSVERNTMAAYGHTPHGVGQLYWLPLP